MKLTKEFKEKFHNELRDRCARMVEKLDTVTPGSDFHADFDMEFNCLQLELAAKWMFKCLTNDPYECACEDEDE